MAKSGADGDAGIQRKWLYTNAPRMFRDISDLPYYHINLDTWYFSEWEDPNHFATLGALDLGERPLTAAHGVETFIAQQVTTFRDAFSDLFRPAVVLVGYKTRLTGVAHRTFQFSAPKTQEDGQAIQHELELSSFEGITSLAIPFNMWATVHDDSGHLTQVWLPDAGQVWYYAHFTVGSISTPPAATYLLTPSAMAGFAHWTVACNATSPRCFVVPTRQRSPVRATVGGDGCRRIPSARRVTTMRTKGAMTKKSGRGMTSSR